jgi:formylglycine-generating enzyme required for sulfatase activity
MSDRSSSSAACLLHAIVIIAAGLPLAWSPGVRSQSASPATVEKVPDRDLAAQIDDALWSAIKGGDRTKVFEEYLRQFPAGRNAAQAANRLAGLWPAGTPQAAGAAPGPGAGNDREAALWKVVLESDNPEAYEVLLKYYPKGRYAPVARSRLKKARDDVRWQAESVEDGAWQVAEKAQTADAYAAYVASYPQGRYAPAARMQVEKLRAGAAAAEENRLWQAAEKGGIAQLDAYLVSYPNGSHAVAAGARRDQLRSHEAAMIPGRVVKDCPDCPQMVVLPEGSFQMGEGDGKMGHAVRIERPFAMAKTEVTQAQWRAVMGANPGKHAACDDCPVEAISWNDAQAFVEKLSGMTGKIYRLPSEAEWEYACRAGGRQAYCGSDDVDRVAWHGALVGGGNSGGETHPVGQKQANAFGLYDMSGNVAEWVEDCYHENYNGAPVDGSAWTIPQAVGPVVPAKGGSAKGKGSQTGTAVKANVAVNRVPGVPGIPKDMPKEKDECKARVLRGGSWLSSPQHTRATYRVSAIPDATSALYGFRPVWSLRLVTRD